jgi:hypothetical protein
MKARERSSLRRITVSVENRKDPGQCLFRYLAAPIWRSNNDKTAEVQQSAVIRLQPRCGSTWPTTAVCFADWINHGKIRTFRELARLQKS